MIEVVIPAHNAEPFLRETLDSVAAQSRLPDLVTVVDDRSRDATHAVAERAAAELAPRLPIRILATDGPPGPSAARNTAIRASRADLIALLDADDLLLPGHVATLAGLLEANRQAVLAFGDSTLFESATGRVLVASHHESTACCACQRSRCPARATRSAGTASAISSWSRGSRPPPACSAARTR
jgi:glycosyltransferase involved in cell wall biosynthesis